MIYYRIPFFWPFEEVVYSALESGFHEFPALPKCIHGLPRSPAKEDTYVKIKQPNIEINPGSPIIRLALVNLLLTDANLYYKYKSNNRPSEFYSHPKDFVQQRP